MNCYLQNILYINLHILFIIYFQTSSKIQKLSKIQQVHRKLYAIQFLLIYLNWFLLVIHLN